jgi:rare lipoprotein A
LHANQGDDDMIHRPAGLRPLFLFALVLPAAPAKADPRPLSGIASVYAYDAQKTASGESAHSGKFTAAHPSLPFGTRVQVTNTRNGKTVVVRINDRGPFIKGRVIDVTPVAAKALGFSGLTRVTLAVCAKDACAGERSAAAD